LWQPVEVPSKIVSALGSNWLVASPMALIATSAFWRSGVGLVGSVVQLPLRQ
jgi:hypothetical protein